MPECLKPGTMPWLLARFRSQLFPTWLFKGWRGESGLGRAAWPPVVLFTLLLLRWSEEGMSRLGSTRRAATDARWRAAMGLSTALTVTRGNVHDGKVAHRLVRRAKYLHEHISQVLGDTAYGAATLRHRLQTELEVKLVAPPPPHSSGSQTLGREAIVVDFDAQTATCAAGVTTDDHQRVFSNEYACQVSLSVARRDLSRLQDGCELQRQPPGRPSYPAASSRAGAPAGTRGVGPT